MSARPFVLGSLVFTLLTLLFVVAFQDMPDGARFFNFERTVLLSIATSIAASAAFFFVVEIFRTSSDSETIRAISRLHRIERELGVRDVFPSKSQSETIAAYKRAVANAKDRVWAAGLSNNQFYEQHATAIKQRKQSRPHLDVRVHFFDPDATVTSAVEGMANFPLVNLFDFPRALYRSEKRTSDARAFAQRILEDSVLGARVFYVLVPSYFSLMIIDDIAFFFPYLMAPEDASSNPMMMVDTTGELGRRLVEHVQQLSANRLLCREILAAPS